MAFAAEPIDPRVAEGNGETNQGRDDAAEIILCDANGDRVCGMTAGGGTMMCLRPYGHRSLHAFDPRARPRRKQRKGRRIKEGTKE